MLMCKRCVKLDWAGVYKLGPCPDCQHRGGGTTLSASATRHQEAAHMCCLCFWGDLEEHSLIKVSSIVKEDTFQQQNMTLLMICLLSSPACSNLTLTLDSILGLIPPELICPIIHQYSATQRFLWILV